MFKSIKNRIVNYLLADQESDLVQELTEKLEVARQQFIWLTQTTNEALRDYDLQSGTVVWNHGLLQLFGYPHPYEVNYEVWLSLIHPTERDQVISEFNHLFASQQKTWTGMYRFKCASGSYKHILDQVHVVYHENKPQRMIGTMQDIDERMLGLAEIDRLSIVASKTDSIVIITDANLKIEWVNQSFVRRTGYSLKEVIGQTPRLLQGADTDKATIERIRKAMRENRSVTEELLNYTKHGEKYWVKVNINPVLNEAQNVIRWIAVETDITRNKEYESRIITIARE